MNNMPEPQSPHDSKARRLFRRALITLCTLGLVVVNLPKPHVPAVPIPHLVLLHESCASIKLTGLEHGAVSWYDCTRTFSDGSKFRRIGDVKP